MAASRTTALANYDEELAKIAGATRAVAKQAASSGGKMINTAGGRWKIDGKPIKSTNVDFIILDNILVNALYEGSFDPNNPASPICFAMGRDLEDMAPHKDSTKPQHKTCDGCPKNDWGSADTGRGKACKNTIRLAVVPPDSMSNNAVEKAEIHYLSVPPTSTKNWASYTEELADEHEAQALTAVTNIELEASDKGGFLFLFTFVEKIEKKFFGPLIDKYKKAAAEIDFPFAKFEDDAKTSKGKSAPKNPAASARRAGKY